jgi:hypothetical protein
MLLVYGQCYQLNFTSYTECPKSTENYAAFVKALELRYGDHHLSQVYQLQFRARVQKSGENLQEFAADVASRDLFTWPTPTALCINK